MSIHIFLQYYRIHIQAHSSLRILHFCWLFALLLHIGKFLLCQQTYRRTKYNMSYFPSNMINSVEHHISDSVHQHLKVYHWDKNKLHLLSQLLNLSIENKREVFRWHKMSIYLPNIHYRFPDHLVFIFH